MSAQTPRERFVEAIRGWCEADSAVFGFAMVHGYRYSGPEWVRQAVEAFAEEADDGYERVHNHADCIASLLRDCGLSE